MSNTQVTNPQETYGKYASLRGAVANAIASFNTLVEGDEFRAIGAIDINEAGFVLGVDAKEGAKVVLFARSMCLPFGVVDSWGLDEAVRRAYDKNAKATAEIVAKYTTTTKEGNLPKWASRDALVASLGKVGKKAPTPRPEEALAAQYAKSFIKYLSSASDETVHAVLAAIEARGV